MPKRDRATLAREAAELRASGLTGIAIADRLGLSRSYAYALLTDPDGSHNRERKRKYDGVCVDCGGRTVGDGGRPPERCAPCSAAHQKRWTPETVIRAIQLWADRYGTPPSSSDWNAAHPSMTAERFRRFKTGEFPAQNTVQYVFGSWNAGIVAAGFAARSATAERGVPAQEYERTAALYSEGLSAAAIAREVGITPGGVRYRLKRMGVYRPRMSTRGEAMGAPLRAEDVLQREVEKMEVRAERLRSELAELEENQERLRAALNTLRNGVPEALAR